MGKSKKKGSKKNSSTRTTVEDTQKSKGDLSSTSRASTGNLQATQSVSKPSTSKSTKAKDTCKKSPPTSPEDTQEPKGGISSTPRASTGNLQRTKGVSKPSTSKLIRTKDPSQKSPLTSPEDTQKIKGDISSTPRASIGNLQRTKGVSKPSTSKSTETKGPCQKSPLTSSITEPEPSIPSAGSSKAHPYSKKAKQASTRKRYNKVSAREKERIKREKKNAKITTIRVPKRTESSGTYKPGTSSEKIEKFKSVSPASSPEVSQTSEDSFKKSPPTKDKHDADSSKPAKLPPKSAEQPRAQTKSRSSAQLKLKSFAKDIQPFKGIRVGLSDLKRQSTPPSKYRKESTSAPIPSTSTQISTESPAEALQQQQTVTDEHPSTGAEFPASEVPHFPYSEGTHDVDQVSVPAQEGLVPRYTNGSALQDIEPSHLSTFSETYQYPNLPSPIQLPPGAVQEPLPIKTIYSDTSDRFLVMLERSVRAQIAADELDRLENVGRLRRTETTANGGAHPTVSLSELGTTTTSTGETSSTTVAIGTKPVDARPTVLLDEVSTTTSTGETATPSSTATAETTKPEDARHTASSTKTSTTTTATTSYAGTPTTPSTPKRRRSRKSKRKSTDSQEDSTISSAEATTGEAITPSSAAGTKTSPSKRIAFDATAVDSAPWQTAGSRRRSRQSGSASPASRSGSASPTSARGRARSRTVKSPASQTSPRQTTPRKPATKGDTKATARGKSTAQVGFYKSTARSASTLPTSSTGTRPKLRTAKSLPSQSSPRQTTSRTSTAQAAPWVQTPSTSGHPPRPINGSQAQSRNPKSYASLAAVPKSKVTSTDIGVQSRRRFGERADEGMGRAAAYQASDEESRNEEEPTVNLEHIGPQEPDDDGKATYKLFPKDKP